MLSSSRRPLSFLDRPRRPAGIFGSPSQPLVIGLLFAAIGLLIAQAAAARTIAVGPGHDYALPSAAVAAAADGDTIAVDPGNYFDCAIVKANRLTIEGSGPGVVMTDKTCEGKAILVILGRDITVRNLTLTRARVPDSNGAGIRAEGANLSVENVHFIKNESGILAGDAPRSTIRIVASEFVGNGKCATYCAHGVYVGKIALLRIEGSTFFETRIGHHVKSRAKRTELVGNQITDGESGTSSYLVDVPNGGALIMENNTLEKGRNATNHSAAIVIGAEGVTQPTPALMIRNNRFTNDLPQETIFVRNLTATEAVLAGNVLRGRVVPLTGDGAVH
jgi:nitrous oxidase accessory protein NosD